MMVTVEWRENVWLNTLTWENKLPGAPSPGAITYARMQHADLLFKLNNGINQLPREFDAFSREYPAQAMTEMSP